MPVTRNITGQRHGRLVAVRPTGKRDKHGDAIWLCNCDCGSRDVEVSLNQFIYYRKSCGCLRREAHERTLEARCKLCHRTPEEGVVFAVCRRRASGLQEWCNDCLAAWRTSRDGRPHGWRRRIALASTEQEKWELILSSHSLGIDRGSLTGTVHPPDGVLEALAWRDR